MDGLGDWAKALETKPWLERSEKAAGRFAAEIREHALRAPEGVVIPQCYLRPVLSVRLYWWEHLVIALFSTIRVTDNNVDRLFGYSQDLCETLRHLVSNSYTVRVCDDGWIRFRRIDD